MFKFFGTLKVHRRTQRDTPFTAAKWAMVEQWAQEQGCITLESDPNRRLYKRKMGWTMPPAFVEMRRVKNRLELEAWVKADAFLIISLLTQQPSEIRLDRGGLAGALPRSIMRKRINPLLERLNLPRVR